MTDTKKTHCCKINISPLRIFNQSALLLPMGYVNCIRIIQLKFTLAIYYYLKFYKYAATQFQKPSRGVSHPRGGGTTPLHPHPSKRYNILLTFNYVNEPI